MDGLSAAASGIAVVSLALQLVDSVRQIQRFLRNVSEAPKELRRLIDLLEQLELILESIGELINKQQQIGNQDAVVSDTVLRAMRTCENTVRELAGIVDKARESVEAKSRKTKMVACFRLECKRRDVEEFERRIQEAVSLLNLTMTTRLMAMHSESMGSLLTQVMATNQVTTTISQELVLLRNNPLRNSVQSSPRVVTNVEVCTNRRRNTSRSKLTQSTWTRTPLGTIIIRKHSRTGSFDDDGDFSTNSRMQDENTWIFMPSFFSRCIEFRYSSTWGGVQGALRTYPVIRDDHPAWKMCYSGDVEGLQRLFSERQLSPFSVDPWGRTLLRIAVTHYQSEVCKLLFQIGNTGVELNRREGRTDVECVWIVRGAFNHYFEPSVQLYNHMISLLIKKEHLGFIFTSYKTSPIPMAIRMMWKSNPGAQEPWRLAIRHVLDLGVDLHATYEYWHNTITTLLEEVLDGADHPFDAYHLGQMWLELLLEFGIDLVEYLDIEYKLRYESSRTSFEMAREYRTGGRSRHLVISKQPPAVFWEWYIDPKGMAFDVLREFKDFGTGKQNEAYPNYYEDWPFVYPKWPGIALRIRLQFAKTDDESRLRTFHNRCERREHKKAMKLARAQGLLQRGPKIPGAWIE